MHLRARTISVMVHAHTAHIAVLHALARISLTSSPCIKYAHACARTQYTHSCTLHAASSHAARTQVLRGLLDGFDSHTNIRTNAHIHGSASRTPRHETLCMCRRRRRVDVALLHSEFCLFCTTQAPAYAKTACALCAASYNDDRSYVVVCVCTCTDATGRNMCVCVHVQRTDAIRAHMRTAHTQNTHTHSAPHGAHTSFRFLYGTNPKTRARTLREATERAHTTRRENRCNFHQTAR